MLRLRPLWLTTTTWVTFIGSSWCSGCNKRPFACDCWKSLNGSLYLWDDFWFFLKRLIDSNIRDIFVRGEIRTRDNCIGKRAINQRTVKLLLFLSETLLTLLFPSQSDVLHSTSVWSGRIWKWVIGDASTKCPVSSSWNKNSVAWGKEFCSFSWDFSSGAFTRKFLLVPNNLC